MICKHKKKEDTDMKKLIAFVLCMVMVLAALATVAAGAAEPTHEVDRSIVYKAAFGTPIVDGQMDDIYLQSDVMYAENVTFSSDASVKEGANATAEYRIVWNRTTLFIFCTVTDHTRSNKGSAGAAAGKMDNTDIYVMLDPDFSFDKDYSDRQNLPGAGQFRYHPNCTIDQEPDRAISWGSLTLRNLYSETLNYVGGYLNETDGSYSFEMCFDYNEEYQKVLAANIKTRTETAMGFCVQVNDVMDNDGKRDALIFSNNGKALPSKNLNNCGKVLLAYQDGVEIPEEVVTTEPPTSEPGSTPTEAPTGTPTGTPTEKPTEAPTKENPKPSTGESTKANEEKPSGGCSSSLTSSIALLTVIGTAGVTAGVVGFRKKKH